MSDYLTRDEAAGILSVTPRTVDRYIERGQLKKYTLRGFWVRVKVDEVQRLKTELTEVVAVVAK